MLLLEERKNHKRHHHPQCDECYDLRRVELHRRVLTRSTHRPRSTHRRHPKLTLALPVQQIESKQLSYA